MRMKPASDSLKQFFENPQVREKVRLLTPDQLLGLVKRFPRDEQEAVAEILEELRTRTMRELAQEDFMAFVKEAWPTFIGGRHHKRMAKAFEEVANGEVKRLIINMPPRHTKSEFASYLLPAWFLGKFPHKKVIQTSHTAELAVGFGRKVRNLVDSEVYKRIFPHVGLQTDSAAAGRWNTNFGGDYFAIGVGGAVTGKGADLLIIDDPHSEQEAAIGAYNPEVYDKVYEWYTSGPRQRLQPGGSIVIVMTRWSLRDLTAQVVKAAAQRGGEEWKVIEFPALFEDNKPLWPEFWSLKELLALREELPTGKWMAQYQQQPTSDTNALVKREWWQWWEHDRPPQCEFIIQAWDTAHEIRKVNDYSACTTWGVFYNDEDRGNANIILLNSYKERLEFPELKKKAFEDWKEWEPDAFLVEKKAAGAPLVQEFRAMGIPVQEYTPSRGQDKISRLNSVADMFASGKVWAPRTRWAEELVDEIAAFPSGEHDDLVDSATLALMRFRQGGYLRLPSDEPDDIKWFKGYRRDRYYTV
jgi:predicted phage terminase large subunit-like protein